MKPLIISLGQRFRGDDGVGPAILDALRSKLGDCADYIENTGDTAALMHSWEARNNVFLIDACDVDNAPAGRIYRLDGLSENLPADTPVSSSHALTVAGAIELGKLMNALPQSLTVYSVVGKNFSYGVEPGAPVRQAVEQVAALITDECRAGPTAEQHNRPKHRDNV